MSWTSPSSWNGPPRSAGASSGFRPTVVASQGPPLAVDAPDEAFAAPVDAVATFVVGGILLRSQVLRALHGSRFRVVGSECDGTALRIRRKGQLPSLAVVEAGDGSGDVAGLILAIRQRSPGTRIVLAGDFGHPNWLQQPLDRVDGLVQADARPDVLVASLDLVMLGGAALPRSLTALMIEQARESACSGRGHHLGFDDRRFTDLRIRRLSALEKAVLCCLKEGAANKVIARHLGLTVSAVNIAIKGILRKVGARNRTQAALWALENLPGDGETR
ncbi:MAG: response regulator transcription factor [Microvirga sp.]